MNYIGVLCVWLGGGPQCQIIMVVHTADMYSAFGVDVREWVCVGV